MKEENSKPNKQIKKRRKEPLKEILKKIKETQISLQKIKERRVKSL
jgi:hypothetical protein